MGPLMPSSSSKERAAPADTEVDPAAEGESAASGGHPPEGPPGAFESRDDMMRQRQLAKHLFKNRPSLPATVSLLQLGAGEKKRRVAGATSKKQQLEAMLVHAGEEKKTKGRRQVHASAVCLLIAWRSAEAHDDPGTHTHTHL